MSTGPTGQARAWNNALMDFGSAVCTKTPKCGECPLRRRCVAYKKLDFTVAVPTQSTFTGSNRLYRGAILKALASGPKTRTQLVIEDEREKSADALAQLIAEGLVVRRGSRCALP